MDRLFIGGILLLKEPEPTNKNEEEYDQELQRIIRPKKKYVELLTKHGCELLAFTLHKYQNEFAPEYSLIFRRVNLPVD